MATKYASGKYALAYCDRCGMKFKLSQLRKLTIKNTQTQIKVCPQDWEPSHPQLRLGERPVYDPQALREPRTDTSYYQSGTNINGLPSGGSRMIEWGWSPIGGARLFDTGLTQNSLIAVTSVGIVKVKTAPGAPGPVQPNTIGSFIIGTDILS